MKRNLLCTLLIVLLVLSVLGGISINTIMVSAADYPAVYVDPASTIDTGLTPGSNYSVAIKTNYTGSDVTAWQFNMSYNPSLLNGTSVINGDLIDTGMYFFNPGNFDNVAGTLSLTGCFFFMEGDVASGPGTLAILNFTVMGYNASDLTLGIFTKLIGWNATASSEYDIVNADTMPTHIGHGYVRNYIPGEYPMIYVDPASTIDTGLTPGSTYTVSIKTNYTGSDVTAWQFTLSYNPNLLNGISVTNGDLIDTGMFFFVPGNFNNTAGTLSLTGCFFFMEGDVASGPGTLANVTFTVMGYNYVSDITLGVETKLIGWNSVAEAEYDIVNAAKMPTQIGHGYFRNYIPGEYPMIYVDPASTIDTGLTPGSTYTVSIKTNYTGSDVTAWQFTLSYNPNLLNGISVTNGDLIDTGMFFFVPGNFNNTAGTLSLTGCFFFMEGDVASGPGTLANVTFTVMGYNYVSDITLGVETKLIGWNGTSEYDIVNAATMPDNIGHGYFRNYIPGEYPVVYVDPAVTSNPALGYGSTYTVSIKTNYTGSDVTAWQFTLSYNPNLLNGISVTNGDLIDTGMFFFVPGNFNNTAGTLSLTGCFFFMEGDVASGPGTLANVTFTIVGYNVSDITLGVETKLIGWNGTSEYDIVNAATMPTHVDDGYVRNYGQGDANGDQWVDIFDIGSISAHWYPGPPIGPLGYGREADLNLDGSVDMLDIEIASVVWGYTYEF